MKFFHSYGFLDFFRGKLPKFFSLKRLFEFFSSLRPLKIFSHLLVYKVLFLYCYKNPSQFFSENSLQKVLFSWRRDFKFFSQRKAISQPKIVRFSFCKKDFEAKKCHLSMVIQLGAVLLHFFCISFTFLLHFFHIFVHFFHILEIFQKDPIWNAK